MFCKPTDFDGKKVTVWGIARSGAAAARLLCGAFARVTLCDSRPADDLVKTLWEVADLPCKLSPSTRDLPADTELLVLSPGVPLDASPVLIAKNRSVPIMGELELAYIFNKSNHVCAVTGTNGKTTTTALLHCIFEKYAEKAYGLGNIGLAWSGAVKEIAEDDFVALEVSSFQLETTVNFKPNVSIMLNITPDHLDRHHTMGKYIKAKTRIFANQGPGDTLVYRAEDAELLGPALAKAKCKKVAFSINQPQNIFTEDDLQIPGQHNLENALAASAACLAMGIPANIIKEGIRAFQGVEHRTEFVAEINGVAYINDSKATNPDSTIKAIASIKCPTVLIAGGCDKKTPFDALASQIVQKNLNAVVLIGETADIISNALTQAGYNNVHRAASLERAVKTAAGLAPQGGQVLLSPACASFDMFRDFEERGCEFKRLVGEL
ncbi:MAG: UDP-N-acetylmuramoyl-L-alanine--D-glutamate ligase [Clostridia bacterium]|nr:UDP-N-acetylmuramoyl-L-alanine--D-glutamate ligase [Clostridia bacterium]